MNTIIAAVVTTAVIVADFAVTYAIGKTSVRFISWIISAIRNAFR